MTVLENLLVAAYFGGNERRASVARDASLEILRRTGLLEEADKLASDLTLLQLKRLELSVYADNARAIALYERFGFEREGLMRAYAWRNGRHVDAVAMARLKL